MPRSERILRRKLLASDLRRLNDVLAITPLNGRYWVIGGLLLGWARDGRLLDHDLTDADFVYESDADDCFIDAVPVLVRAGFQPLFRYTNNEDEVTEHVFFRRGAQFDFFRATRVGDRLRYYVYTTDQQTAQPMEVSCEFPAQPLEPFEFLTRKWLKPRDHEAYLEAVYGNWRTPDPNWSALEDCTIVESRPWKAPNYDWEHS